MKTLLLISSRDLAAIKRAIDNPYLEDALIESEVDMEEPALQAIIDMIESEEGEEISFVYEEDFDDEDIKY